MINKYIGMGYVAADPDFNEFKSGKCKASFSLGINYGKDTTWIEIECWDKIATNCNSYLKKGSLVFVEGKLKYSSWKGKQGEFKSKLFCIADFIKIINLKNEVNEVFHRAEDIKKVDTVDQSNIINNETHLEDEFADSPW